MIRPLVFGAALVAAQAAHAMSYAYRTVGQDAVIDASGPIEENEGYRFGAWLKAHRLKHGAVRAIVFDSPGGQMHGGVQLAAIIEAFRLSTGVAHGGMCESACVMAWSAGVRKSSATDAAVGVHMARLGDEVASDATLFYAQFLRARGAPANVITELISTRPDSMYVLTRADLEAWNVALVDAHDTPVAKAPGSWRDAPVEPAAVKVIVGPGVSSPPAPGAGMAPLMTALLLAALVGSVLSLRRR